MNATPIYNLLVLTFVLVFFLACKRPAEKVISPLEPKLEIENNTVSYGPESITRTIIQDRIGNIWIASFEGVFKYDGNSFENITREIESTRFFSVLQDRDGNFWFSSIGSGVYFYDGKELKNFTVQEGLPDNRVTHIYEDGKGKIWFGTEGGLSMYDGQYFKNFTKKDGLPHDDVSSIIEDHSGKIWIGTRNGICYYDGSTITVLSNRGKKFANVRSIIQDKSHRIWFGGNDGLWNYDGTNFLKFSDNFVGYISEDKYGNIWTSSESSQGQGWEISRYDQEVVAKGKSNFTQIVSSSEMIFGHLIDNEGNLWFGALGVYKYDGSSVISFKKPDIKI